ncbi:MAG: ThiJ/PfpI family protein [Myxococcales bacterium]|nr:ThiJ/PfpI family protein [Myxococcales bacterium]
MGKRLKGVRVAVLAVDGVEQVEATLPMRALRKAGADVRLISLRPGNIRSVNFIWRGKKLAVDDTVFQSDPEEYAALLLPGGFVNPDLLRQSERVLDFVSEFDRAKKPIATLCHGPAVLISANLIDGRRLASWPGIADDVRNAGGQWEDSEVVRDDNWVSSRSPLDLRAFTAAMIELFAERAPRGLPVPPRRVRWVATVTRLAKLAAIGGAIYGARRALIAARA